MLSEDYVAHVLSQVPLKHPSPLFSPRTGMAFLLYQKHARNGTGLQLLQGEEKRGLWTL
jgi:hypothetical protein